MTRLCSFSGEDEPVTSGVRRQRAASLDSAIAMKLERHSILRQLLTAAPANLAIAKQPRPARLDAAVLACRPCTTISAQITPKKSPRRLSRDSRDSFVPLKSKGQRRDDFHDTTPPLEQSDSADKVPCPKKRRALASSVALLTDMPPLLSRADAVNTSRDDRNSPSTDSGFESSAPASPESAIGETQSTLPPLLAPAKPLDQSKVSPQARSQCQWQWCSVSFENDTLLFDHVIQSHIRPLKPGQPAHNTRRRRSNSDCDRDQLQCRWGQCALKLERGDVEKRYAWLEDHFTTRHPGRALPYPCLITGCQQRFSFKRALADHLLSGHDKLRAAAKRDQSDTGTTTEETQKRCKRRIEQPSLYAMPVDPKMDFLDGGTGEILAARLLAMEVTRRRRLEATMGEDEEVHGAARRKQRRLTVHEVFGTSKKRATALTAHSNATPLVDRCRARPVLCALFARVAPSKVGLFH